MKSRLMILLAGLLPLLAIAANQDSVSLYSYGHIRFGMDLQQLADLYGKPVVQPDNPDQAECFYTGTDIPGVRLMISHQSVARVNVYNPIITTGKGAKIGDTVARIRQLYGPSLEETSLTSGILLKHYLTSWSGNRAFAIRFETRHGKVTMFYAGRAPEVEYQNGCE